MIDQLLISQLPRHRQLKSVKSTKAKVERVALKQQLSGGKFRFRDRENLVIMYLTQTGSCPILHIDGRQNTPNRPEPDRDGETFRFRGTLPHVPRSGPLA